MRWSIAHVFKKGAKKKSKNINQKSTKSIGMKKEKAIPLKDSVQILQKQIGNAIIVKFTVTN